MLSNPGFAIRGVFLSSIVVILLTTFITTNATFATSAGSSASANAELGTSPETESQVECQVSQAYPQKILRWCNLITRYAIKHDLPPDLIAALIWQESGGSPAAYSRSGAVGLMQVMPRDGIATKFKCPNGPCFAKRPTMDELRDPEFNIQFGTRMLAGLFKRKGSLREALHAYGPMDGGYYYADKVLAIYEGYGN
ncbi:MAG: hypothetical protein A2W33_02995 [Chloroflexi bacterium RBG_16_52_11]|nr:MAG: hypothetical protein A2W33_02995 [Chloroflexi bacterium RBG_16_52_11]